MNEALFREQLLQFLVQKRGYPAGLIAKELRLDQLMRRCDLLIYRTVGEKIVPLLLIECKKDAPMEAAFRQLIGYNQSIGAPFLAVASPNQFWFARKEQSFRQVDIPTYKELLSYESL